MPASTAPDPLVNIFAKNNQDTSPLESATTPVTRRKFSLRPSKRWHKLALGFGVAVLLIAGGVGAVGAHTYTVAKSMKAQAVELLIVGASLEEQLKEQNLPAAEASLIDVQNRLQTLKTDYNKLGYYRSFPIASGYYRDGEQLFVAGEAGIRAGLKGIEAIKPYADVLGFQGEGTFTGGTTEDRIKVVLETLGMVSPVMDEIAGDLQTVETALATIDPNRYPEKLQGREIRSNIIQAQQLSTAARLGVTEFKPVVEVLPEVAGANGRKKYLVIFQNDNELRPTGGFMTAYAVMYIEDGKVTPDKSDDIYELDKKFRKNIPIPAILGRYLTTEKRWNLRDMNISPDFKVSMDTFYEHYKDVPGEPDDLDGIVTIDSEVLGELVKLLGPVDVPGYGVFSAENDPRCDCPQIIYAMSEIITRPTPYIREDRKGIIAPMMQAILQKAYGAPNAIWPQLAELAWKNIEEKHIQMYLFDEKHQAAAETVNAAGRMMEYEEGSDYFAVVDANLGGAKSNLFVTSTARHAVSGPENGMITRKTTLTYDNPRRGDNCNLEAGLLCLNSVLFNWSRIYLPPTAENITVVGFSEQDIRVSEELGLKVVEGSFRLNPLSSSRIEVQYSLPYSDTTTYRAQLRKQAGTGNWPQTFDINGYEEEVLLNKDQTVEIAF